MSEDWQAKLRKLHDQLLREGQSRPVDSGANGAGRSASPSTPDQTNGRAQGLRSPAIDAVLGIDFGTRFTKVAVFLPHINQRIILRLGPKRDRVVPSRIILGDNGRLYSVTCGSNAKPQLVIEYLKNRLASPGAEAFGASLLVGNIPLDRMIKAACSFYLVSTAERIQASGAE